MARYTGPREKYMRRFGLDGRNAKRSSTRPKSEYGKRLEEKQRLKFIYGILEKQFVRYVKKAFKSGLNPGKELLRNLETRLDNIVYRSGLATTRPQARQLVSHGHIYVDDKKTSIPSFKVSTGQTITLGKKMKDNPSLADTLIAKKTPTIPAWMEREGLSVKIKHLPYHEELPEDANMSLVMEIY